MSDQLVIEYIGSPQLTQTHSLVFEGSQWKDWPDDKRKRFIVNVSASVVSISLENVVREDTGIYSLVLQNELGRDQIIVDLVVAGKVSHQLRVDLTRLSATVNYSPVALLLPISTVVSGVV